MDFFDILIYVSIIFFAIVGFNNGFFKSIINIIGFIVSLFVTHILRATVAELLIVNLPFLDVGSFLKTAPALNILLYQLLAFILLFVIAELVYNLLISILGLSDLALRLGVKTGIVSKILGIFSGVIEGVLIIFLCVFILSQPFIKLNISDNSTVAKDILKRIPFVSDWNSDFINVFDGIQELTDSETITNANVLTLFLNEKMVTKDTVKKLLELHKINSDEDIEKLVNDNANVNNNNENTNES